MGAKYFIWRNNGDGWAGFLGFWGFVKGMWKNRKTVKVVRWNLEGWWGHNRGHYAWGEGKDHV